MASPKQLRTDLTVWDIMNFGATGDGTTDDTAAIQSAINAAATSATGHGGGIVYFPPGNYKVSSTLQITAGGIHLLGPGPSATQLIGANASADIVNFSGTSDNPIFGNSIRDMTISSTVSRTGGSGINVAYAQSLLIDFVDFFQQFVGISLGVGTAVIYVSNIYILSTSSVGLLVEGGNDQYISNLVANNQGALACVRIRDTGAVFMSNCDLLGARNGLLIDPVAEAGQGQGVLFCSFDSVYCDSNGQYGVQLNPQSGPGIRSLTFTSCWTASARLDGFLAGGTAGCDGIHLIGHRSFNNSHHGLRVGANNFNFAADSSDFSGNGQAGSNVYDGIHIHGGTRFWQTRNCKSGPAFGFGGTQRYGIAVEPGYAGTYMVVGNVLGGNMSGGLQLSGVTASSAVNANNLQP